MTKRDEYRRALSGLGKWEPYLLEHSGLPGPRANIELGQAAGDMGSEARFDELLEWTPDRAPTGSREEFLAFCGTIGLGRLVADGRRELLPRLKELASDPRWRIREAVALGLQRWGAVDVRAMIAEMRGWASGSLLECRAAAAAICEPSLLTDRADAEAALVFLDGITARLAEETDRKDEGYKVLRKALAYCWSVAAAAAPERGRIEMERWMKSNDPDVRWVMRQNLGKKRILALGQAWVDRWTT
jgi:hypothetical protein